jgi:hypothetical protein
MHSARDVCVHSRETPGRSTNSASIGLGIVPDAAGALHGDGRDDGDTGDRNSGSDHWSDGEVRPIEAGIEVLTTERLRVLAEAKARQSRYW